MNRFFSSTIGQLRLIAFLEGCSYILLFFITMPLKHIWEMPLGSAIVGPIHGLLFTIFVVWTIWVAVKVKWDWLTIAKVLISSLIPFGTFYVDHTILKEIHTNAA